MAAHGWMALWGQQEGRRLFPGGVRTTGDGAGEQRAAGSSQGCESLWPLWRGMGVWEQNTSSKLKTVTFSFPAAPSVPTQPVG